MTYFIPLNSPTATDVAITFIPFLTGTLSIIGASAIMYNILSDPRRRFTAPYFRIMFGLSVADIIFSITSMTSTFAAPKDTPFLFYARGDHATCQVQAFFMHLGYIQPMYMACLSIYYLLVIKYNMSDEHISNKYEMWMHITSLLYPLIGSIVSACLGLSNPTKSACWIVEYPPNCHRKDKSTCIRGVHSHMYMWIFSGSVLILSLSLITYSMGRIILFVRHREQVMKRRFSFRNNPLSNSRRLMKQTREVLVQGFLYIGCFIFVWIFVSAYRLSHMKHDVILILSQIFWPMQGFCNAIIYYFPRYSKTRDEHPDKTVWWIVKDMIITTTFQKEQRRAVFHSIRRRRSTTTPSEPRVMTHVKGKVAFRSEPNPMDPPTLPQNPVEKDHGMMELNKSLSSGSRYDPVVSLQQLQKNIREGIDTDDSEENGRKRIGLMMIEVQTTVANLDEEDDFFDSSRVSPSYRD